MMRQDFIESDRDLAHKLIDKGVDFQTLGPAKYEDAPMEAMAGNFKKWYTKHWDRGVGADLSPDEKQRILKLTE